MTMTRMELGRCRFCGHDEGVEAESQYDADQEVTERCTCPGAERHRKFERARDSLHALAVNLQKERSEAADECLKMAENLDRLEKVLS